MSLVSAHGRTKAALGLSAAVLLLIASIGNGSASAASQRHIVALGDSFTSGEGNGPYQAGTDTAQDSCHRSITNAYPQLAGKILGLPAADVQNFACSGAGTTAIWTSYKTEPRQDSHISSSTTDVVLTIFGNDTNAVQALQNAVLNPKAVPTIAQTKAIIAANQSNLTRAITDLKQAVQRKAPNAQIWVVGYPQILSFTQPGSNTCFITKANRQLLDYEVRLLDAAVKGAANQPGVHYIDAFGAFDGHLYCGALPGMVYGPTLGNGVGSFHPNPLGQQTLAKIVANDLKTVN